MTQELTHYGPQEQVLTVPDGGTELIMRAVEQMSGAHQLAKAMATTAFVPAHFRGKPDDVAAAIMYGAAIGLDPMSSLRAIYVVGGNPGMYARQMVAVVLAKGHRVWTEEETDTSVTVAGQRRGSEIVERVTWTIERAELAGYVPTTDPKTGRYRTNDKGKVIGNEKYLTEPRTMLYARAAGDLARRIAPDALAGLDHAVEELQVVDHVDVTPTSQARPRRESAASLLTQAPQGTAPSAAATGVAAPGAVVVEGSWEVPASDVPRPADAPAAVEPEPEPDGPTPAQTRKMGALTKGMSRDERVEYTALAIRRAVDSWKDVTKAEAGTVIDALERGVDLDGMRAEVEAEAERPDDADYAAGSPGGNADS